jgi:hypothetical protein
VKHFNLVARYKSVTATRSEHFFKKNSQLSAAVKTIKGQFSSQVKTPKQKQKNKTLAQS